MAEKQQFCFKCNHPKEEKDQYCIKCGTPFVNRCTKKASPNHGKCLAVNRPEAAYCAKCGSPTLYNELGLI